jgi:hypothetical protein
MHNCVVFGSASGGISMVSAALTGAGYRMARGDDWTGDEDNPARFTLDESGAWTGLVASGEAHGVCVFRHPGEYARALLAECPMGFDPEHPELDMERAVQLWCGLYGGLLDALERDGSWCFLHEQQALADGGLVDLGEFLGVALGGLSIHSAIDMGSKHSGVSALAMEIYAQLCVRAQILRPSAPCDGDQDRPQVSVLALIGPGEEHCVPDLLADVAAQQGVDFELVIIDQTDRGGLIAEGAEVLRCADQSRGRAWNMGAAQARADVLAWWLPGYRLKPTYLGSALDMLEERRAPMRCVPMARRSG